MPSAVFSPLFRSPLFRSPPFRSLVLAGLVAAVAAGPARAQTQSDAGRVTTDGAPAAAQAAGAPSAPPAAAPAENCSARYAASLNSLAASALPAVEAAREAGVAGDPGLPGRFLFPPRAARRTRAEIEALVAANALAISRGRSSGTLDADKRWIADRLRVDLADYLRQKPAPYLCGGVPDYLATLRGFADQVGASPGRRKAWAATQRDAARRSAEAALAALAAEPRPVAAPAAPGAVPTDALRPGTGLSRSDVTPAPVTGPGAARPDALPQAPAALSLDTDAGIAAAIDRLLAALNEGGLVTIASSAPAPAARGNEPVFSAASYPMLARLAAARPYVAGRNPLIANPKLRLRVAAALADIEALDYLNRAERRPGDPVATAIGGTLDAIEAAHGRDCTCAP